MNNLSKDDKIKVATYRNESNYRDSPKRTWLIHHKGCGEGEVLFLFYFSIAFSTLYIPDG